MTRVLETIMNAGAVRLTLTLDTGVVGFSTYDIAVELSIPVPGDWNFLLHSHGWELQTITSTIVRDIMDSSWIEVQSIRASWNFFLDRNSECPDIMELLLGQKFRVSGHHGTSWKSSERPGVWNFFG